MRLWIVGTIGDLLHPDAQVQVAFGALLLGRRQLAEVMNDPPAANIDQRMRRIARQQFLMNRILEAQPRPISEQPAAVDIDVAWIGRALVIAAGPRLPTCDRR